MRKTGIRSRGRRSREDPEGVGFAAAALPFPHTLPQRGDTLLPPDGSGSHPPPTRTYVGLLVLVSAIAVGIALATLAFLGAYSGLRDVL